MKKLRISAIFAAAALTLCTCASAPTAGDSSSAEQPEVAPIAIDEVIKLSSERIIEIVTSYTEATLAVYYFTTGQQKSELSDYFINTITTELANTGKVTVVSRQALDRIMEEYSYQLTDLVDSAEQVEIGKHLGADLIVTGFVTPLASAYELNIQVLEVESSRVLGGNVFPFILPEGFDLTTTMSAQRRYATIEGVGTKTTIYEDFESGYADMPISHEEEHWGERIIRAFGKTSVTTGDTGSYARYEFGAEFDHVDMLNGWHDSDVGFYFRVDSNTTPGDADGLAFSLRTGNFASAYLSLRQFVGDEAETFWVRLHANPGEMRDFKIPFDLFMPGERWYVFDREDYFQIELYVSFGENYPQFHFREGTEIHGSFDLDNIGLYSQTTSTPDHVIASFEDEVDRMVILSEVYGTSIYYDYEESDEGVLTINPYVTGQRIHLTREAGGPAGTYFSARAEIEASTDVAESGPLDFLFWITAAGNFAKYNTLSLFVRSDLASYVDLEIQDYSNDEYYYADFSVSDTWSRQRIDLEEMGVFGNTALAKNVILYISFNVPPELLAERLENGVISIDFAFDDMLLENR